MRILLVEDDAILGAAVRDSVAGAGHAVDWVQRLADAQHCLSVVSYNLILLDLMLPDGRGLDFLKQLRTQNADTPVIILTARDQISDRIAGLHAGADDYLVKPFDLSELAARMGAVTRRSGGHAAPVLTMGDLVIDQAARKVMLARRAISLTAREWAVLEAFLHRPGFLVPKAAIEERLYALDAEVESNTIEVYVARLRKKIGADRIITERGQGYRFNSGARV